MRIVIVGEGKVGHTLVKELSQEGHDIVIIDNNVNVVERSLNTSILGLCFQKLYYFC